MMQKTIKKKFLQFIPLRYEGSLNSRPKEDYLLLPSVAAREAGMGSEILTHEKFYFVKPKEKNNLAEQGIRLTHTSSITGFLRGIRAARPDITYANSRTLLSFMCPLFSRKSILISHDCEPPSTFFGKLVFRLIAKMYTYHRVNTPYEQQMLEKLGVKKEKIKLIPLAVDVEFFSKEYTDAEKQDIRKKYNLPGNYNYITFVANFRSHKTPIILIKAMRHLRGKKINGKEIKAILIGDDQLPRENLKPVKELVKENNVKDSIIRFENFRSAEIRDVLAVTDAYVHPTFREGQCLAVYEAAAAQKTLCLSSIGSFTSVFKGSAYFHEPMDDEKLAGNIIDALSSTAKNKEFIKRNNQIIERTRYDAVKAQLKSLIKGMVR